MNSILKIYHDWLYPDLDSYNSGTDRMRLIKSSRILVIDDEEVGIIKDLTEIGYSVVHDRTGDDLKVYESKLYDLMLLDYDGVGKRLGSEQGLHVLRHVKRINKLIYVIAYTSKQLRAQQSDFFKESDDVIDKDESIADSIRKIENGLSLANNPSRLFDAYISMSGINDQRKIYNLRLLYRKALKSNQTNLLQDSFIKQTAGYAGNALLSAVLDKIVAAAVTV